jgi:hypothetical protein
MLDLFSQQTLILIVGILLLATPVFGKAATFWVMGLIGKSKKTDFDITTVVQLMELRNALEREGAKNAASICRDLVFAVVYGDSAKKD